MNAVLTRIKERESTIGAYLTIRSESDVLEEAQAVDDRRRTGSSVGILAGLPVAIKDNLCTKALRTTCGSRMLASYIPPYDATVVERIKHADGIILGKTNLDEFSMGSSTENSAFHVTRNPRNHDYVPGGTSGGSAAAIGASETILAIGSDTGGSIRQPASFCGVVGMKPTYGRVSRYGLVSYASSFDQVGPVTKTTADAALLLSVIAGHDSRDATSSSASVPDYLRALDEPQKLTFGVPSSFLADGLNREVRHLFEQVLASLQAAGHNVRDIDLPHSKFALSAYYILACAEASANLARFDGVRYGFRYPMSSSVAEMYRKSRSQGFGPEVKRRIMLGTFALSAGHYDAYYEKAARARSLVREDYANAFESCDAIIGPVSPVPPFRLGEKLQDPMEMYLADVYTVAANLSGHPAISVPAGITQANLPVGVQVTVGHFKETLLLNASQVIEKVMAGR